MRVLIFAFALLLVFGATAAIALVLQPMQLVDEQVFPACLTTSTDIHCNQTPSYGTCGKGPAVKILNKCGSDLTITAIETSSEALEKVKPVFEVSVFVPKTKKEEIWMYKYTSDSEHCKKLATSIEEDYQKEVSRLFKEKTESDERRKRGEADPLVEWRESVDTQWFIPLKTTQAACNKLTVGVDREFSVGMPYGSHYRISGFLGDEALQTTFELSGLMTKPSK